MPLSDMLTRFGRVISLAGFTALLTGGAGASEVSVYTYREPGLVKPLFDAFTKDTGVKVNVIFASQGLEQRMATEGANSPADLLLTVDIARLEEAKKLGVTQPLRSEVMAAQIPSAYRDVDGHWWGVSMRARVVYASKERFAGDSIAYEDLADPKFKGRVCIRSGQHIYNNALFAGAIARMGETKAETWLRGLKANLAKKPSGGDRDVARDIAAGQCDIGVGNTYYVGLMLNREPERKAWADAIKLIKPTFNGGGTHVNLSGVAIARYAPNRDNAVKLAEWLVSPQAQQSYAAINFEYPLRAGVALDPTVASWGALKPDTTALSDIAGLRAKAADLVDRIGFDN